VGETIEDSSRIASVLHYAPDRNIITGTDRHLGLPFVFEVDNAGNRCGTSTAVGDTLPYAFTVTSYANTPTYELLNYTDTTEGNVQIVSTTANVICTGTSVGLESVQQDDADMLVFPNPSSDGLFHFHASHNPGVRRIEIFNIMGEVIFSTGGWTSMVDLSKYPAGFTPTG
jgi:hypothetical protein